MESHLTPVINETIKKSVETHGKVSEQKRECNQKVAIMGRRCFATYVNTTD